MQEAEEIEENSKIRSLKSLKFVRFLFKDVAFYLTLPNEEIGIRVRDLLMCMMSLDTSEYAENQAAIEEALHYMKKRYVAIEEWRRTKVKKEKGEAKPEERSLFNTPSVPDNWRELPKHELQKIMTNTEGITEYDFTRWYEDSEKNEWKDSKYGQPIRNPIAACRSYIKGFEQQQKEKKE